MAIPIINDWEKFFSHPHEGLGSSYERIVLNELLLRLVQGHKIDNALESPSFGFTGVSGINLLALADAGVSVTLEDNDPVRLDMIGELWKILGREVAARLNREYRQLDYPDKNFGMSFSFSALWFVPDLLGFLSELARVTQKVVVICVPNRNGVGYKMQIKDYSPDKYPDLKLKNIDPPSVVTIMKNLGWNLTEKNYFDCPPWPDIGMTKEEFLRKWLPFLPKKTDNIKPKSRKEHIISILSYYRGEDRDFAERMKKLQWFERLAPTAIKRVWAHHIYLIFTPAGITDNHAKE
jgi:hypothetical protein